MINDQKGKKTIVFTDIKVDSANQTNPKDLGELANSSIRSGKKKYVQAKVMNVEDKTRTVTIKIPLGHIKDFILLQPKTGLFVYPTGELIKHLEKNKKHKIGTKKDRK